jgi:hypothetical protein
VNKEMAELQNARKAAVKTWEGKLKAAGSTLEKHKARKQLEKQRRFAQ